MCLHDSLSHPLSHSICVCTKLSEGRVRIQLFNTHRLKYSCWSLQTGIVSPPLFTETCSEVDCLSSYLTIYFDSSLPATIATTTMDHHHFHSMWIFSRRIANKSLLFSLPLYSHSHTTYNDRINGQRTKKVLPFSMRPSNNKRANKPREQKKNWENQME